MVNVELMFEVSFTLVALLLLCIQPAIAAPPLNSNCTERCGNVNITYPFGMGKKECYLNEWFEIECNKSVYPHRPFLRRIKMEVLDISAGGSATVISPIVSSNCSGWEGDEPINLTGSPFYISNSNSFISVGCNTRALLMDEPLLRVGCDSSACNGTGCCKITVPSTVQVFNPILNQHTGGCELAFLAVDGGLLYRPEVSKFPMVLDWTINSTQTKAIDRETANCSSYLYGNGPEFQCYCNDGYEGNPYIGCTDTDECKSPNYHFCRRFTKCMNTKGSYKCVPDPKWIIIIVLCGVIGVLAIPLGCWRLYKVLRKLRDIQLKKKFFKRNGGLLLKQQLNSSDGSVQKTKIFSSKELEKATDRFSENRILGQGGQGTVYKGMLTDGRIVAIKKSKLLDEEKLQEFINEVVILSQVNHRNVVRLLGCCLETEVPLLVYEFIPNGSLFQYLHDQSEEAPLPWDMRLRIAGEVAGALAYLHSAASIPIYHRDIKSTNVLLDEKNRAKVSDFGTSRSITIDQTHLTTRVQGTFGYLDPEYYQTSQFTDKSDVYSFGVVLVELLSGKKPIYSRSSEEIMSLAMHFVVLMEENRLFDIIDARIVEHCAEEEITEVANLAKRCLNLNGKKRPTMKEVAAELDGIQTSRSKLNIVKKNNEEIEDNLSDDDSITESYETQETISDGIAIAV
ncbi:wall-associated receptor kinase-like 22 [Manihot esculenta]|uniref:Uncharacterized protein n=3 Tax=Manihot esculenta TaxID=3983 RepID=A0ACB7HVY5_MANES|nr:wall-associated receptor kinase-like 22 [Manihot esculenta]KAG8656135.1 hypothetical protein MANES_04G100200v8 [Manihot esculenta]KAG8656136.1 hypothetical protein MANES_04G100200v8 [Manihot esculenta]